MADYDEILKLEDLTPEERRLLERMRAGGPVVDEAPVPPISSPQTTIAQEDAALAPARDVPNPLPDLRQISLQPGQGIAAGPAGIATAGMPGPRPEGWPVPWSDLGNIRAPTPEELLEEKKKLATADLQLAAGNAARGMPGSQAAANAATQILVDIAKQELRKQGMDEGRVEVLSGLRARQWNPAGYTGEPAGTMPALVKGATTTPDDYTLTPGSVRFRGGVETARVPNRPVPGITDYQREALDLSKRRVAATENKPVPLTEGQHVMNKADAEKLQTQRALLQGVINEQNDVVNAPNPPGWGAKKEAANVQKARDKAAKLGLELKEVEQQLAGIGAIGAKTFRVRDKRTGQTGRWVGPNLPMDQYEVIP